MTLSIFRCFLLVPTVHCLYAFVFGLGEERRKKLKKTLFSFHARTHMWFPSYIMGVLVPHRFTLHSQIHLASPNDHKTLNRKWVTISRWIVSSILIQKPISFGYSIPSIAWVKPFFLSRFFTVYSLRSCMWNTLNPRGVACYDSLIMKMFAVSFFLCLHFSACSSLFLFAACKWLA